MDGRADGVEVLLETRGGAVSKEKGSPPPNIFRGILRTLPAVTRKRCQADLAKL